jgi:hypothetical protein
MVTMLTLTNSSIKVKAGRRIVREGELRQTEY